MTDLTAFPNPLAYDAEDARLYMDDSEADDVLPTVAWMDTDNADPETNNTQGQAIVEAVNRYPALLAFVEQMARMMTPEDEFAALVQINEAGHLKSADELLAEYDHDRLYGEYETFMEMVAAARKLLA